MSRIGMYDPLTSEARSPLIAGLTEACSKLSYVLDLNVEKAYDMALMPVYISDTDKYRIYQAPLGNKLWLETPAPVIKKNGIVITPENDSFTIDYFGGSICFENNKQLTEFDYLTIDVSYIVGDSATIENLFSKIESLSSNANKFRGYYSSFDSMQALVENPTSGDFAIVGGTDNSIYIWNSTYKKWENTYKITDLSNYYQKPEVDNLLDEKENTIVSRGTTTEDDNYYYGGRKTWQNVNDKVRSTILNDFDDSNKNKVTEDDTVLSAVGKLQGQINDYVHDLFGNANPTTTTEGKIGQDYTNISTGEKFWLKEIDTDNNYIWVSYQIKLTFDENPTDESNNLVTSGGIYTALENKTDKVIPANSGNIATLDSDGNLVDSGKGVDDVGKSPVPNEITLLSTNWTTDDDDYDIQEVTVNGVISDSTKQIIKTSPKADDFDNIQSVITNSIYCVQQKANALVFKAYTGAPEIDVIYNVEIQNI